MQTAWLQKVFYYEGRELRAHIAQTVELEMQTDPIDIRDTLTDTYIEQEQQVL